MDSAAYYGDLVINSGRFIMETDFMNLWQVAYPKGYPNVTITIGTPPYNYDGVSGIAAGESAKLNAANSSREIIFAAQFRFYCRRQPLTRIFSLSVRCGNTGAHQKCRQFQRPSVQAHGSFRLHHRSVRQGQ